MKNSKKFLIIFFIMIASILAPKCNTQEGVDISGQIWSYSLMWEGTYYIEPAGGVSVTAISKDLDPDKFTTTTSSKNCLDWWQLSSFECGKFTIEDIPQDTLMMLKAKANDETDPDCLSKIFNATEENNYQIMILATKELVEYLTKEWNITLDSTKGIVVALLAKELNPNSPVPISGFIGGATVTIDPLPDNKDFRLIYFNSKDFKDTSLKSTDPEQSLVFMLNVPVKNMDSPYTIKVNHDTYTFPSEKFAVEAGNITYLLLLPQSK